MYIGDQYFAGVIGVHNRTNYGATITVAGGTVAALDRILFCGMDHTHGEGRSIRAILDGISVTITGKADGLPQVDDLFGEYTFEFGEGGE